ncbi:MAG: ABC transporter permease, partial [Oscillospiraceae bacterium]
MNTKIKKQIFGMSKETFMKKYGIIFILLLMIVCLSIASPTFRTVNNWVSILQQISTNGVLALGMVFVITAGGIDLSIGSMLALTSVIIGVVLNATDSIVLAVIVSIVACAAFGLINGCL